MNLLLAAESRASILIDLLLPATRAACALIELTAVISGSGLQWMREEPAFSAFMNEPVSAFNLFGNELFNYFLRL